MRTLAEIVVSALTEQPENVPVCILHENLLNVRTVKAGTNVTLGFPAHVFSPNDAMWFSGELGQPDNKKPKYVGMVVFVPTEVYERRAVAANAATPSSGDDRRERVAQT